MEAAHGSDALQQVEQPGAPLDFLRTDIRIDGMDGIALTRSALDACPKTPFFTISGYPFDLREQPAKHSVRACAFLSKPFTRTARLAAVPKCLSAPPH